MVLASAPPPSLTHSFHCRRTDRPPPRAGERADQRLPPLRPHPPRPLLHGRPVPLPGDCLGREPWGMGRADPPLGMGVCRPLFWSGGHIWAAFRWLDPSSPPVRGTGYGGGGACGQVFDFKGPWSPRKTSPLFPLPFWQGQEKRVVPLCRWPLPMRIPPQIHFF